MTALACHIASDLTTLRLAGEGADLTWRAPRRDSSEEAEATPSGPSVRERAEQAADFLRDALRRQGGALGTVCVSVDEAMCSWLSAPSAEQPVIAAAMRRRASEWNRDAIGESVQPLTSPTQSRGLGQMTLMPRSKRASGTEGEDDASDRAPGASGMAHLAVLEALDGPLRLWLDALDRRGARPAGVQTLWHALASVWASDSREDGEERAERQANEDGESPLVCVLFRERDDRLVWAWGSEGNLVAGGGCADAPAQPRQERAGETASRGAESRAGDIVGRLSLDWLTWSAQRGRAPGRMVIVAPDASDLADEFASRWPETTTRPVETPDPLGLLLERLSQTPPRADADDPRRSLLSATRRPGQAHRRFYRAASLAIALLAAGATSIGWQAQRSASALRDEQSRIRAEFQRIVGAVAPNLAGNPSALADPVRALQSELALAQQANPTISEPDPPPPIKAELERFLAAVAGIEGLTLEVVSIDERLAQATVASEGFAPGEGLLNALRDEPGRIRWQGNNIGSPPALRWRLNGQWEDES